MTIEELRSSHPDLYGILISDSYANSFLQELLEEKIKLHDLTEKLAIVYFRRSSELTKHIIGKSGPRESGA